MSKHLYQLSSPSPSPPPSPRSHRLQTRAHFSPHLLISLSIFFSSSFLLLRRDEMKIFLVCTASVLLPPPSLCLPIKHMRKSEREKDI